MDIDDHVPCGRPRFSRNLKGVRSINKIDLPKEETSKIIDIALAEDISYGDITSEILIPPDLIGKALILVKEAGILAGSLVAKRAFLRVDPSLKVETPFKEGAIVKLGDIVATISGKVSSILKAERTALNFLQRLSGIASLTSQYVAKTEGNKAIITDTRKTTPGIRLLEKYAVLIGGGKNHRFNLADGILIKDNHLAALRAMDMSLKDIVTIAKRKAPKGITVEVEVTTAQEALDGASAGADIIMLDNMTPDEMGKVIGLISDPIKFEASGGITLANLSEVAMSGVDIISVGALTHSAKALDISLELEPQILQLL